MSMFNKTLGEWEYSSLKRDIDRNLSFISDAMQKLDSVKREVDSQMRDYKYAQSSYERAWEEKIKNELKKASSRSGYSSYGYSSCDSKIHDAQRIMERCLSKVVDSVSGISEAKRKIDSAQREVERKVDTLVNAYEGLTNKFSEAESKLKNISQKCENLSRAKTNAELAARSREQELQDEVSCAKRSALVAGATAAAAVAEVTSRERESDRAVQDLAAERRAWEQKTVELKNYYENEISKLKNMLVTSNKGIVDDLSLIDDLAANLADALKVDEGSGAADSDIGTTLQAQRIKALPPKDNPSLIVEYAALWNRIMEDAVIEMDEVKELNQWASEHVTHIPEGRGLMEWCEVIVSRGEVVPDDAQTLYDRSFMLLKALGAKLG